MALSPDRRQAIIWTNTDTLLTSEMIVEITFVLFVAENAVQNVGCKKAAILPPP